MNERTRDLEAYNVKGFLREALTALQEAWCKPFPIDRELTLLPVLARYLHESPLCAVPPEVERQGLARALKDGSYEEPQPGMVITSRGYHEREPDGFALALLHAMHLVRRMAYCANPGCEAPYFLSARNKFCSKMCAAPAQKAHKLGWWNKHKVEELAKRAKARAKRRKKSQRKGGK
jgi:hypothetical protein